jgi:hypothetical protein
MIIDFEKNPRQFDFFSEVLKGITGQSEKRHFFYGGAIRGGKSFVCAASLLTFCKMYPNSRWHIFRSDFPALNSTIIPTFEKIVKDSNNYGWNRDKSNYFIYNKKTDAKIFFRGENISHDPTLDSLLGLETNGIFYEQIEELSEALWNVGNSRNGSWYIDNMPTPITLATFNPTQKWIKKAVHEPFLKDELKPSFHYQLAYPTDNAFVTEEQKKNWENLDERYKRQFILGDWSNFDNLGARWAYAYEEQKHLGKVDILPNLEIILSFDFNKNPISCSVVQVPNYDTIRVIETIKLANSDIFELCQVIKTKYGNALFLVTGDASGSSTSAMVQDNMNYYKIIKSQLNLSNNQLVVPVVNPRLADNRVLVNSLLSRGNVLLDKENTKSLQFDFENVTVLPDGSIKKADRSDPAQQADALDTFRYACNSFCLKFLNRN